jgi:hypothetical protein
MPEHERQSPEAREAGSAGADPLPPEGRQESPSVSSLLTLQEGLKEYGQHKPGCGWHRWACSVCAPLAGWYCTVPCTSSNAARGNCTCGFSALLLKDDQPDLPRCVCGGINEQTGQSSCLGHGIAVRKDDQ